MKVEEFEGENATVSFSKDELQLFLKSAEVIFRGFVDGEFHTRTGYFREEGQKIMADLLEVSRALEQHERT